MTTLKAEPRELGGSGVMVPRLGLGCAPLGNLYAAVEDGTAAATIDAAWWSGVRLFDTAPHYGLGLSERRLGAALDGRPGAVVSTKVGRVLVERDGPARADEDGFAVESSLVRRWDFSAAGVRRSLEASLVRLRRDGVDIALLHDPDDHLDQAAREGVPGLTRLRDEGLCRAVGAGMNDWRGLAALVERCDLDVVLVAGRYTLLEQDALHGLLDLCARRGTAVLAAGIFNSGILASASPTPWARYDYARAPREVLRRAARLAEVCARYGSSLPHAALHFPLAHPAIVSVVVGARTAQEVRRNAALLARPVPPELWTALRREGLLPERAPVPGDAP